MNRLLITLFFVFCGCIFTAKAQPLFWGSNCENRTLCLNQGSCSVGAVAISELAATTCNNPDITYFYQLDIDSNGSFDQIAVKDTLTGNLPRGTHRIFWRASDVCGRVINCSYTITIDDCQSPTLLCNGGISTGLSAPDCKETFNSDRFITVLTDNCTPANLIKKGLRRVGEGTGFPPTDSITFERCNIGLNLVEVWVKDQKGRLNQCNTYVLVQENASICPCVIDANINMRGCVKSGNDKKFSTYKLSNTIKTEPNGLPALNRTVHQNIVGDSCFNYNIPKIPLGGPFRVTTRASRSGGSYLDGVTTSDIALISRHILNVQPFQSIYQALAADVNGSNTITTLDIVDIRRLILGISDSLSGGVPSWRLVRPVANPAVIANLETVRDTYQTVITGLSGDVTVPNRRFIGFKMGDVNFSGPAFFTGNPAEDRSPLRLEVSDRMLTTGERVMVPIVLPENISMSAWQMALQLDTEKIRLHAVNGVAADHYFQDNNGILRLLWYAENDQLFQKNKPLFELDIEVLQNTTLSEVMSLASEMLKPEVYTFNNEGRHRKLSLNILGNQTTFRLLEPQPNPFARETTFRIELSQAEQIQMEIFNPAGQRVLSKSFDGIPGWQDVSVVAQELGIYQGLMVYRISAGASIRSGKIIRF